MLEIDISGPNKENNGEDLMKIKLKSQNTVQISFSKFLFHSKSISEKCSEIMKLIEREIAEAENKYEIEEEIIKEFIEIVEEDKVSIPIEHYKDIYTLSKHFCIVKLTNLLDNMMSKLLVNDLNFSIQVLLDQKGKKEKEEDTELVSKIENFLKTRVNECMKNDKFKELPITTIYRIIESAILNDRKTVDINVLFDFIVESAVNRFILFRFVELHRLSKDRIDEFIKFIDEQEESSKQIYLEYIPFDFLYFKEMKHNYDELSNNFNHIQEELIQTKDKIIQKEEDLKHVKEELKHVKEELKHVKEELKHVKEDLKHVKEELKQTKEELQKTKEESNQAKDELILAKDELQKTKDELQQAIEEFKQFRDAKQSTKLIMVGGCDDHNQLGEKPNKQYGKFPVIHPPQKSSINPSSLLSFSTYSDHSIQVTKRGKLLGIGDNKDGRIGDSLPKTEITEFTEFSIRDVRGSQLDPVSAVCSKYGTLYMFSSGSRRQLVLCDSSINGGHPIFLDIGDEYPVSLFGGYSHSAAISNKGEVIFINRYAVKKSPESIIKPISLPDGEKAVSVACCNDSVVALSSNGRVFLSDVESGRSILNFSTVSELSGQEIVWVSGINEHFLAVNKESRVFGRGSNKYGQLGLEQKISKVSSFTEILSLKDHKIRAAYAGSFHSLFETREGKILACGYNSYSELLLSIDTRENVYSPKETTITESATFCIVGNSLSIVFIGGDPPPNTPNKLIQKFG